MNSLNSQLSTLNRARYIMIGGFLGAGKTTAVAKLAGHLHEQGLRVGLITNDQGNNLVDTAMLSSRGFPTEEIAGGCFCCRFNSLMDAAKKLSTENRPDVFIAEPVGSCTDLVATVTYPLRRIYGNDFSVAPLSVLVDPIRALRILGVEAGDKFSPKVTYIYRKQLEEADVIVVNKSDLLDEARFAQVKSALSKNFPKAKVFKISARNEMGLLPWFEHITSAEQGMGGAMEVDYEVYADGEALLGWLNCTVEISGPPLDGNQLLAQLAESIQLRLNAERAEVAHLKMTLSPNDGLGDLAVINLVRNDFVPELSQSLGDELSGGQLILNLRAESSPEMLRQVVEEVLAKTFSQYPQGNFTLEHIENFRPGKPQPTHRMTS
jgi:Ni2+-binding GTPase involved in maturation of urease and hydrogenase